MQIHKDWNIRKMCARNREFHDHFSYTSWCPWCSSIVSIQKRWPVAAPGSPISRHSERWMIRFVPKLEHQKKIIPSISVLMPQTPLFLRIPLGQHPRTQPKMGVMWTTGANQVRGVPHFVIRTENSRTASWEKTGMPEPGCKSPFNWLVDWGLDDSK